MSKIILAVLAPLLLILIAFNVYSQKSPVSPEAYSSSTIPDSLKENAHTVIRYHLEEMQVKSPGKAVLKEHLIQTILDEKDENRASMTLYYDKKFSEINDAEMRVYDSKGILIKRYKKSDFYERSAVDNISIITDSRLIHIEHSIVSYPITVETISEITMNGFLDLPDWSIQEDGVSVEHSACKVLLKPALGFRYKLKNFSQLPEKGTEGEYETYSWKVKNLKARKPEENSQPWSFLPRISFATNLINYDGIPGNMGSWKGFGAWLQNLNKNLDILPEKRVAEIRQMVAGISSDKEKAKFLYEYMQKNMRYVSIQLGIGGLKPFPASFVDEKKYGDCKALSNYMHTLLKCVDIPSYYAVINAGENEEPADPEFVNNPFNHIVLCIPFKGDTTWLECTSSTHPFGKLGAFTENRRALLVTEDGGKLVNTPKSFAEENLFESESAVHIAADGTAKANLKIRSKGEYRNLFLGLSYQKKDDQKQYLIDFLNLKQPDIFEIKETVDKDGLKEIALDMEYAKLSDVAAGGKFFYRPRIFDLWRATLPIAEKRNTNYYFDHPMLKKSKEVFLLPLDFEVEAIPADVSYKSSCGSYSAKYLYDKEKHQVLAESCFELSQHIIPPVKYNEIQKFMDDVAKSMSKKLIVRKKV